MSSRLELSSMADDYARYALSQRACFEATHPAVLAAVEQLANEPVLRVADLGVADGVNSHGLIRDLAALRGGRPLNYAHVDLPTSAWGIAARHLPDAFDPATDESRIVLIPAPGEACPGIADAAGLASSSSIFPSHPDHANEVERRAWRGAAERHWERLLVMRAAELAPGGWFVAVIPASTAPCPDRTGVYNAIIGDMNRLLADWRRTGRIGDATVEAAVVPVWPRTLDEFRAPFESGGGRVASLELKSAELFRLDNPYRNDDPAVFARDYVEALPICQQTRDQGC